MARAASPADFIPRLSIGIPGRLFVATIPTAQATKALVRRSVGVDLFGEEYAPVNEYLNRYGFTQTSWQIEKDGTYDGGTVEVTVYTRAHDSLEGAA
ncbi:hypothetical protein FDI11_gp24 [Mycobacterium phage Tiger]|uniref:Uncharacterized protein n=2 Tax=Benedictvirus TaxID=2946819 RepID=H9NCY0_9CAUD|nr:hypothetical protein X823_gp24 [Mycobacterium phage Conspiracy]YP_008859094.1 hypothetical protein X816_gp22 [Mycobacterium phage Jovo]YP_009607711.1 hypothetical protein FDI11_gp24 [Mycobacterium phage Tiger]ATW60041.1 hypothetical protein SEA_PHLORENCE_67 [Mycobacterium phage Phlorence]ATW60461.1 hypothetical protein SEA_FORGETIT_69 [Mycobacterium phage ForGetIt]ATW61014.1 hypothetical protein SEA_ARAGOG_68 [Mycobacterium phage Aragog]ATW61256.1 hypothetical protein SEA_AGENTM_68 [Mycoba